VRFDFGNFALDTDKRELTCGPELISIGPKVFDVLVYLIENRDRVVSKDELLDAVWGGRIVSESTLTSHINAVRKAVGDTGAERNLVRTLPRKGFRFVGEVATGRPQPAAMPTTAVAEASGEEGAQPTLPDKPSIAVLPFANMSSDPEQGFFADGITEDLITDLSKMPDLFVSARNSSFAYKGTSADVRRIARELGVQYVLEGSVRKAGDRVRISAQLIDPSTGFHLWAERYDRSMTDIFALQDEITKKIAEALEIRLSERDRKKLARRYTSNPEAYELFLRGREQFLATNATNAQVKQTLLKAIRLDPNFAAAYAILFYALYRDWFNQWSDDPLILDRAFEAAEKAVVLDKTLPLARAYLAWAYLSKKQHERAIEEAECALSLDPSSAEAHARLGEILNMSGRPEDGLTLLNDAMRLDPHYPVHYIMFLGDAYYVMGNYEEAIAALERCLSRAPYLLAPHRTLSVIFANSGRENEARREVEELLRISPRATVADQEERLFFKDHVLSAHYLDGLRKAGLPP